MRDTKVFAFRKAMPRMSWSQRNLYNLWRQSCGAEAATTLARSPKALFQQHRMSKALVRAYHAPSSNDDLNTFAGRTEHLERRGKKAYDEQRKALAPVSSLMLAEARRLVVHGSILLNGKKEPGSTKSSLTPFNLPPYASPFIFIPAYAEVSFPTCSAIYVRHPMARPGYMIQLAWYSKMRPRTRSKNQMTREPDNRSKTRLHPNPIVWYSIHFVGAIWGRHATSPVRLYLGHSKDDPIAIQI
ncbi:hypothetical protein BDR03DRAFT_993056 [Suillus americanus]|nr:hypothetical protein BDR03DRAFT_993056 [Suillus americanus]